MLDLGWSELLVIGIVALIVVGPKDLPRMLRTLGQYAAKAKSMAREFQRSLDEAARQADIDELREVKKDLDKDVAGMREAQYKMQREMSQSVLDKPEAKARDKAGSEAKKATEGGSEGTAERAGGEAPKPAPKPAAEPAAKPSPGPEASTDAPADEAGPEPRKASGA